MTTAPPPGLLQRYLAVRGLAEVAFWILFMLLQALANTVVAVMDVRRNELPFAWWQVATWELSSHIVILALVPGVLWLLARRPLHWGVLRRNLPWHALASLVFCGLHVAGMVALRKAVYATLGRHYDIGDWPTQLFYEALKDVRSYVLIVMLALAYRLLLWRWQGEARLLAVPDDPAPAATAGPGPAAVEPSDRPERFLVKKLGKEFLLPTAEIEWVQACGNYVNLHRRQHDYPLRATLAGIERRLDPALFVRVHRSWLVNLVQVEAIEPTEMGDARVRMKSGSAVPCSRTYLDALRQRAA